MKMQTKQQQKQREKERKKERKDKYCKLQKIKVVLGLTTSPWTRFRHVFMAFLIINYQNSGLPIPVCNWG